MDRNQDQPAFAVKKNVEESTHWIISCEIQADPAPSLQALLPSAHSIRLRAHHHDPAKRYIDYAEQLLERIKRLVRQGSGLLQLVVPADDEGALFQGLGALLRTATLEHPGLRTQTLAVDGDLDGTTLARHLAREVRDLEPEVRYWNGERSVRALEEIELGPSAASPWHANGVYLITGGAGGLGLILADAITAAAPGATLILLGRRPISAEKSDRLRELEERGGRILYRALDITDSPGLAALVAEQGPITGVIHCAGQLRDGPLLNKGRDDLHAVLAPKVDGLAALDTATLDQPLNIFLLFSSTSSVFGNPGQADYALGNGFLDAYAEWRNHLVDAGQRQGRTLTVNWPFWSQGGMTMSKEAQEQLHRLLGMSALETGDGLAALNHSWVSQADRTVVLAGDRERLRERFLGASGATTAGRPAKRNSGDNADGGLVDSARRYIAGLLRERLKLPESQLEGDVTFDQYGLDSVTATELASALEERFGELSKTVFLEYPTLNELAGHLAGHHPRALSGGGAATMAAPASAATAPVASAAPSPHRAAPTPAEHGDIAIIGLSGRYPGADDLHAYWDNLATGVDCISEVPANRWNADEFFDPTPDRAGRSRGKWGGFLSEIETFDPLLFNIAPGDAALMDPHERLFLQAVWTTLEDGGYNRDALHEDHDGRVGIYAGAMYQQARAGDPAHATAAALFSKSALANRVSYVFGLEGPSVAVDTMCSSAAMAIHLACKDLRQGECELAIAGGVNLTLDPKKYIGLSHLQLLASHPDSRSFGDGDGYLPCDGVGAVLLKPLSRAIEDGDRIRAVIKSSATRHGGRGNGYMVPSPKAQESVIAASLAHARVPRESIGYVEAAANGSPLGDAIEVGVLNRIFGHAAAGRGPAIGAVKSNLGHPEAVSGMAQLTKVVLQLQHGQLVPTIRTGPLNPNLDFERSPLRLQLALEDWPRAADTPRRALVNSFGAGGTCVSLVLEEYASPLEETRPTDPTPQVVVLSALNRERLAESVQRLLAHLKAGPVPPLPDLAHTLQVGREALSVRLALVVTSTEQLVAGLRDGLEALRDDREPRAAVFIVDSDDTRPQLRRLFSGDSEGAFVRALVEAGDLERLALFWAQGGRVGWTALRATSPRRVELPGYPFEARRFPLPALESGTAVIRGTPERLTPSNHHDEPLNVITGFLARELALEPEDIKPGRPMRDYGLESVTGMALLRVLSQTFSIRMDGRVLLDHPTVEALARYVRGHIDPATGASAAEPRTATPAPSDPPADANRSPVSEGQRGLWLLQTLNPTLSAYNVPLCLRLRMPVDARLLDESLALLAREQPLLTSTINEIAGSPVQIRHPEHTPRVQQQDLRGLDHGTVLEHLRSVAKTPFDLATGPLMRSWLFQTDDAPILLVVVHHLIFDGRSIPLLLGRLLEIYRTMAAGQTITERAPTVTYADFVRWERSLLEGESAPAHLNYWRRQLKGPLPVLDLPTDRPRPADGTHRGRTLSRALGGDRHLALHTLAEALQVTPAVLYLGLFQLLLQRYSDERDIIVGMPTLGRPEGRFDDVIGYFVNMVAVRSFLEGGLALPEFMRRLQQTVVDGLDHAAYPFPALVRELRVPRHEGRSPVFQVAFEYQSEAIFQWRPNGDTAQASNMPPGVEYIEGVQQEGEFELALEIYTGGGDSRLRFKYAPELFDADRIDRMMDHYIALLDASLENADRPLDALPMLGDAHRNQRLWEWNQTDATFPSSRCVHDLVHEQAARTPDAVALRYLDTSVTYAELEARADTVARALLANGLATEDRVGVCMVRSPDMVVALLAVMKAGGAYVPLDPEYPAERLRHMLADSGCMAVLTESAAEPSLRPLLPDHVVTLCLDRDAARIESSPADGPLPETPSNTLAYIIYTSGSTGKPKGVMIEHRSVVNLLHALKDEPGFKAGERLLALATYSFDIAVVELFLPLITGGECCLCDSPTLRDGERLKAEIERLRPAYIQATPMTWTMLFRAGWRNLHGIRMICTGEALPTVLRDQLAAQNAPAWNLYGPTETTVYATRWRITGDTPVLIGRPLANTRAYVLDEAGAALPAGIPGELHLGGEGVARGYWNREDLTRERFVRGPWGDDERLYRTGDLARWRSDGELEYLGRVDDQVKIRGYRIEPGEIETALTRHPAIAQCAITVEALHDTQALVAHYVAENEAPEDATLRAHLRATLPAYMIPGRFRPVAALPQTPSGKIDRHALARAAASPEPASGDGDDDGGLETRLLELWRNFFNNSTLGPDDSFFEIGGDSLLAQTLVQETRRRLGLEINSGVLFAHDSVRRLTAYFSQNATARADADVTVDLRKEATLDPEIVPATPSTVTATPKAVMLTGATGFLGVHLLAELLERTDATIHCLVRAEDSDAAGRRLQRALHDHGLWREGMASRLRPLPGRLDQPRLGLEPAHFDALAERLDAIYHNGAQINQAYPYTRLKPANVDGTAEVLRLACRGRATPVHYVSTISVQDFSRDDIDEALLVPHHRFLQGGYIQSKWVAEQLVCLAHQRGLPVAIYRPSRIVGHSHSGSMNTDDLFCRMIKGVVELGKVPRGGFHDNIIPVDDVSRLIVTASLDPNVQGRAVHAVNPSWYRTDQLNEFIRDEGFDLEWLDRDPWLQALEKHVIRHPEHPMATLLPMFRAHSADADPLAKRAPTMHASSTRGLAAGSLIPPKRDLDSLLRLCFDYFYRTDFLPTPEPTVESDS